MSQDPCPKCVARPEPGTTFSLYHCAQDGTCPRLAAAPAPAPSARGALLQAALDCPHSIEDGKVVLRFDSRKPGHNALNQLGARLEATAPAVTAMPAPLWHSEDTSPERLKDALMNNRPLTINQRSALFSLLPTQPTEAAGHSPDAGEMVAVPEGWKLLPPRLTGEMRVAFVKAALDYMRATGGNSPEAMYEAAFKAAPNPPAGQPQPDWKTWAEELASHLHWLTAASPAVPSAEFEDARKALREFNRARAK